MTRKAPRRLRAGILFFAFACLSAHLIAPRAIAQDDHGNNPDSATDLPFDTRISGEISPADVDYFRLTLDTPADVVVRTESDFNTTINLDDANGNRVEFSVRGPLEATIGPGTYYVSVRSTETGTYVISATSTPHLALPGRIEGEFSSAGETEYFLLNLETPTYVIIRSEGDAHTEGRLLDANAREIASDAGNLDDNRHFRIETLLPVGIYRVEVFGRSNGPFTLVTERLPLPSTPLADGAKVSGELRAYGERDYYRLNLQTGSTMTIRTQGEFGVDGRLLDANAREIAADDDGGEVHIERSLVPGTYYVELRADYYVGQITQYVLSAKAAPVPELAFGATSRWRHQHIQATGDVLRFWTQARRLSIQYRVPENCHRLDGRRLRRHCWPTVRRDRT